MHRLICVSLLLLMGPVACGPRVVSIDCQPTAPSPEQLLRRASPYDSVTIQVGPHTAKVCFSRPAARDRQVFGGLVPFDTLWRTGANEPTILHLPFRAKIAGIDARPGRYSLYTVPGAREWSVVVNASTEQWGLTRAERGFESSYTEKVRAAEVGRATIVADTTAEYVERLTFRADPTGAQAADLVIEWERTSVRIPIQFAGN